MTTFNYESDVLITSVINLEQCNAHPYFWDLLECLHDGEFDAYEYSFHFADGAASTLYVKVSRFFSNF
jgi:hypothetical protein